MDNVASIINILSNSIIGIIFSKAIVYIIEASTFYSANAPMG